MECQVLRRSIPRSLRRDARFPEQTTGPARRRALREQPLHSAEGALRSHKNRLVEEQGPASATWSADGSGPFLSAARSVHTALPFSRLRVCFGSFVHFDKVCLTFCAAPKGHVVVLLEKWELKSSTAHLPLLADAEPTDIVVAGQVQLRTIGASF